MVDRFDFVLYAISFTQTLKTEVIYFCIVCFIAMNSIATVAMIFKSNSWWHTKPKVKIALKTHNEKPKQGKIWNEKNQHFYGWSRSGKKKTLTTINGRTQEIQRSLSKTNLTIEIAVNRNHSKLKCFKYLNEDQFHSFAWIQGNLNRTQFISASL